MRRMGVALLLAASLVAMAATPVMAGAAKQLTAGPTAVVWRTDVTPIRGENGSQPGPGFVVFNDSHDGTVMANVALKGAAPNTTCFVRPILRASHPGQSSVRRLPYA